MARANARYYAEHDPFRDFTTAPEIGQVFGELLGAWAAVTWQSIGAPDPVYLVEAGPGRGSLMQDARRATAVVAPGFHAACRVHLVETSPRLRAEQAARVPDATWHDSLDSMAGGPCILFANEFLDALPIRQFVRRGVGWAERHVQDGHMVERPADPSGFPLPAGPGWDEEGCVFETSPASLDWVGLLARRLAREGGAALILDYGAAAWAPGESLQAIQGGQAADPLSGPGSADLTAHVDFSALRAAALANGAACHGPVPQGSFLQALGLTVRTARLIALNPARGAELQEAAARLASPDRMGQLFKVLCLTDPACPAPAGFAP